MNINVAILGTWGKTERFAKIIREQEGADVDCVWDLVPENAEKAAAAIGCRAVCDVQEIFDDPAVTGVVIITENNMHAELAVKAAEAGKHIFIEKPLCTSLEDAYAIRDAVKKNGVKFFMSDPFVRAATVYVKNLMESGDLGRIMSARIRMCDIFSVNWNGSEIAEHTKRAGGGMMSDTGGHVLHIINFLFGKPEKIFASFSYGSEEARCCGREEYVSMVMTYPSGLIVNADCSTVLPEFTNVIEISGSKGMIVDAGTVRHGKSVRYKMLENIPDKPFASTDGGDNWTCVPENEMGPDPDGHIVYWIKMIREDISIPDFEADPLGNNGQSIDKAVELMEMRDAIYRSARSGAAEEVK